MGRRIKEGQDCDTTIEKIRTWSSLSEKSGEYHPGEKWKRGLTNLD